MNNISVWIQIHLRTLSINIYLKLKTNQDFDGIWALKILSRAFAEANLRKSFRKSFANVVLPFAEASYFNSPLNLHMEVLAAAHLVFSSVLRLSCVLQVILCRSHWNCYIMDAIWTLRFARNMVFFWVNGASVAERRRLTRGDGLRRRRFAVESCSKCPRNVRMPGDLFSSLLMLRYCVFVFCMCWHTLCIGTGASKRCVVQ